MPRELLLEIRPTTALGQVLVQRKTGQELLEICLSKRLENNY